MEEYRRRRIVIVIVIVIVINSSLSISLLYESRIVDPSTNNTIHGFQFKGYGAHIDDYPFPYLTASCTIGIEKEEILVFIDRLQKALTSFVKSIAKKKNETEKEKEKNKDNDSNNNTQ